MSPRENETAISIKLDTECVDRLDRYAKKADISRHNLLRNITEVGLDHLKAFRMVGFFQIGIMLRDLKEPKKVETPNKIEKSIPVYLPNELVEKIDEYSQAAKLNRQQLLRNIVYVGLDEIELLFKTGIAPTVLMVDKIGQAISSLIKNGEKAHRLINDG
jgi:predicted DNA-binding protein